MTPCPLQTTQEKPVFDLTDQTSGIRLRAWYLATPSGDAVVQVHRGETQVREFLFPAYKVWNLAAHFDDIVASEVAQDVDGYAVAASDGLGGSAGFRPVERP
jgi:hypothetical protein